MEEIIYQLKCVQEKLKFIKSEYPCVDFDIEVLNGCIFQLENKRYREEIFAEWVTPVGRKPWTKGHFGQCTHCGYIHDSVDSQPTFCEECGATMTIRKN